jgi:DNA invertase Pin-like site-specific DNA recombinase
MIASMGGLGAEVDKGGRLRPGGARTLVAGYIRVSTRGQDYAYQRAAIEQAARVRGHKIDRWYADVASGGTMKRPQLLKLREAVASGEIHRVWVWRVDRLSRAGIVATLQCVGELQEFHCEVCSVADPFALDGPGSQAILAILAWANEMEREKIRENLQAARVRMAADGRNWGRPLEVTAEKRGEIRALKLEGKSVRKIAREVNLSKSSVWNITHEIEIQETAIGTEGRRVNRAG